MRERLFGSVDETAALDQLRHRQINYDPARAPQDGRPDGHWHVDSGDEIIGQERPGPPGVVLAPSGATPHPLARLARSWLHPGS